MNPAECLVGKKLNDWTVVEKIEKNTTSTGGFFSVGYWVRHEEGQIAFLKALDYSRAKGTDQAQILNSMTKAYLHEASLLERCANKKLRYIVQIKDKGQIDIDTSQLAVDCIILEKADTTARSYFDISNKIDTAMYLRSLHNIAVGLQELHTIDIAHQDIKPSNVLLFNEKKMSKVGDVGRASSLGSHAEHDKCYCAGDRTYSPFEQLYGCVDPDWKIRRYSCDMFMLGNLVMWYFNNVSIVTSVKNKIDKKYTIDQIPDTYDEILPLLKVEFNSCLSEFNHGNLEAKIYEELKDIVKTHCEPDYRRRGESKFFGKGAKQYSIERTISRLDRLAYYAELNIFAK